MTNFRHLIGQKMKWNEWNILCTLRLSWTRKTSWGWWYEWDDTALQTQDSKFEPWRSEAEHATVRARRIHTKLNVYEWTEKKHFVSWKLEGRSTTRSLTFQAGSFSHYTRAPAHLIGQVGRVSVAWRWRNVGQIVIQKCLPDQYHG